MGVILGERKRKWKLQYCVIYSGYMGGRGGGVQDLGV